MPALTVLVDGYNVLQGRYSQAARAELVRCARAFRSPQPVRQLVIVFDASRGDASVQMGGRQGHVAVLFAAPDADGYLQERMRSCRDPASLLVVSDDRAIRDTARACGVQRMTAGQFLKALRAPAAGEQPARDRLLPDAAQQITDELRRRLGV